MSEENIGNLAISDRRLSCNPISQCTPLSCGVEPETLLLTNSHALACRLLLSLRKTNLCIGKIVIHFSGYNPPFALKPIPEDFLNHFLF